EVFRTNYWGDPESVSGVGSNLQQTAVVRAELPRLLRELGARSLLDVPCGDFHWMRLVELPVEQYIGGDLVAELAALNQERYGRPGREFRRIDLLSDPLPRADAVFCRDCLVHLSHTDVHTALRNLRTSGAEYLITTTFPAQRRNRDIVTGEWRPLNLQVAPFGFPPPLQLVNEQSNESGGLYPDKSLGVWRVRDLPGE
ncbi:MAG TPA: class I SAM-dependent methyltransferase, partial [Longimicrobium sp.]|nr:class I SAM-dependent methyltransferase [Longimicrobium sp.]